MLWVSRERMTGGAKEGLRVGWNMALYGFVLPFGILFVLGAIAALFT